MARAGVLRGAQRPSCLRQAVILPEEDHIIRPDGVEFMCQAAAELLTNIAS